MGTVSVVILAFILYCFTICKSDELGLLSTNAVQDKILHGAVFELFSKTSRLQCRRLCLYSSRCVSANWITKAKECQLNSRSADEQSLQESHSNIYLAVQVNLLQAHPCSDHPCTLEDICVPVTGSTAHICLRIDSFDQGVSTVSSGLSITTVGNPGASTEATTTPTDQANDQANDTSTTPNNNLVQTSDTSTTPNNNLVQTNDISTTPNNNLAQTSYTSTTANNNLVQTSDGSTTPISNLVQTSDISTTPNNDLVQTSDTSTTPISNLVQTSDTSTTPNNSLVQTGDTSTTPNNNVVQTGDTSTTPNNDLVQTSDTSTTPNNNLVQTSDSSTAINNLVQTSDSSTTANNNLVQTTDTSTSPADGSCSGNSECTAFPTTTCRDGFCTCGIGYDLDVERAVCRDLRECTTFGTEYIHFPGQVIWREDVESKSSSYPVAQCVQLCNEASTYVCKTFEIDTKLTGCYTQDVTWLDVTEDKHVYTDRFDQYQRKCKWGVI